MTTTLAAAEAALVAKIEAVIAAVAALRARMPDAIADVLISVFPTSDLRTDRRRTRPLGRRVMAGPYPPASRLPSDGGPSMPLHDAAPGN